MINNPIYNELHKALRNESRYCSEDGFLIKTAIVTDALSLDEKLLSLLLENEILKNHFFKEIKGMLVFDKLALQQIVSNKNFLPDSWTKYRKRTGISNGDNHYLADSSEIVLAWPHKDCILEGGQTKEEEEADRREIFWSEILAPEEINRLTEPKVMTNFERYDSEGAKVAEHVSKDDNLIIKGNNLLALYSLKKRIAGKVNMIYIDPPYYFTKKKPSDTFSYNSNFRLSTWLTFMYNRFKVAKQLLTPGGVILCHIKEDAIHWTKVLMEEVFGIDNFVETFIWKCSDNPNSISDKSRSSVEYIICYEVPKDSQRPYIGKETENDDAPLLNTGNTIHELEFEPGTIKFKIPDGTYEGRHDRVDLITPVIVENQTNKNKVILKGEFKWSQKTVNEEVRAGTYFLVKSDKFSIRFQRPEGKSMAPEKYIDEQYLSKAIGVGSNEDATTHLKNLGIEFTNSKPESVVAFFIRAITKPGDLILDFFLGSGTTAAVALKMGRRFIGIDQMDYIKDAACVRLQKVIEGEQGGVSTIENWKGGGSFVYCELAKANQIFIDEIQKAQSPNDLEKIWEEMQQTGFLSYKVEIETINETKSEFNELSLEEQKKFLMECLNKNMLYIPLSEIDNEEFEVSEKDKLLNQEFYA